MIPTRGQEIVKKVDSGNVYYTINWSRLKKADKFDIIRSVPSVGGIFELYYMDDRGKLNLFLLAKAWYGGLRHSIRRLTDPELETNAARRRILEEYDTYYRYTLTNSYKDMSDILFFFAGRHFPGDSKTEDSGRYIEIFVNENSPDKIVTI